MLKNREVLQILKVEVEKQSGLKIEYAADCVALSELIFETVHRRVSSSTLKRFFHIIDSPFDPSRYTLDTLSAFTGSANWQKFVAKLESGKDLESQQWEDLKNQARAITEKSLQSLKEKVNFTAGKFLLRPFAKKKLEKFMESPQNATMFVAPDGYGKSVLLIQLVENYFLKPGARYQDETLLLIDGSLLFHLSFSYPDLFILNQLVDFERSVGRSAPPVSNWQKIFGKMVVVIDDLDEVFYQKVKFHQFAENLLRLISVYQGTDWFKIILTCRPESLEVFSTFIRKNPLQATTWFDTSFSRKSTERINIPLFDAKEISWVLRKYNFRYSYEYLSFFHEGLAGLIHLPYFLFLFLKEYALHADFSEIALLEHYTLKKIFVPPYAKEKQDITDHFFRLCKLGKSGTAVQKDALKLSSDKLLAYNELVTGGIFFENPETGNNLSLHIFVRFSQQTLLYFLLARFWLRQNRLSTALWNKINNYYHDDPELRHKLLLLLTKLAIHEQNTAFLKQLHLQPETNTGTPATPPATLPDYYSAIAPAIRSGFRSNPPLRQELVPVLVRSGTGQKLYFKENFDFDSLLLYSAGMLHDYEQNNHSTCDRLFVVCMRFMEGFLGNDSEKCQLAISALENETFSCPDDAQSATYYFTPLILHQAQTAQVLSPELSAQIHETALRLSSLVPSSHHRPFLFEFNMILAFNLVGLHQETLRYASLTEDGILVKNIPDSPEYQLAKLCKARALLHAGNPDLALKIFPKEKIRNFPEGKKYYFQLQADLIKAEFLLLRKKEKRADKLIKEIRNISEMLHFRYFKQQAIMLKEGLNF